MGVWNDLTAHLRELETLEGVLGLLGWDQQTMMPAQGASGRGAQISLLSRLAHQKVVDPRVGEWLEALEAGKLDELQRASVRNVRRAHERAVKVPESLVGRLAEAQAEGFEAWMKAREARDFQVFRPSLEHLVELTREKAAAIDSKRHPYDVLLEEFDPGTTVTSLQQTFARLRDELTILMAAVEDRPQLPEITERFDVGRQRALHDEVLRAMSYDLEAGRMDDAEHPFTVGIAPPRDVRITTHLYEDDLLSGLGGTIHEAGHALYEQGLPESMRGTMVGQAASFGLHESQSRFWENFIGRSRPFFRWFAERMKHHFPDTSVDAETLFKAANRVAPGLVRIKADEVTYNLHIIVRFELELQLVVGDLAVKDLPEAWNARYQEVLGRTPPDDLDGVLQDMHWSAAAFGYFPSYTLGNLYAASLAKTLERDLPELWDRVGEGDFAPVLAWLREKIHGKGHLDDAPELVRQAVGERDAVEDLVSGLWERQGALYGVTRTTS